MPAAAAALHTEMALCCIDGRATKILIPPSSLLLFHPGFLKSKPLKFRVCKTPFLHTRSCHAIFFKNNYTKVPDTLNPSVVAHMEGA